MAQFGANMMDRQRLDLAANAYNTFVRVPRELPSLAYPVSVQSRLVLPAAADLTTPVPFR